MNKNENITTLVIAESIWFIIVSLKDLNLKIILTLKYITLLTKKSNSIVKNMTALKIDILQYLSNA